MKISVITVCYQAAHTIEPTLLSVMAQDYSDVEYIVVDGGSTDGTLELIQQYSDVVSKWISEPDKGIYDAMNKGIALAEGDVIGFLNADDVFKNTKVLSRISQAFLAADVDAVFADVEFVKGQKVVRKYSSASFNPQKFAEGYMPAHPSFYARKSLFSIAGFFRTDFKIASDFDLLLRMLYLHQAKYKYLPETWVSMQPGGMSNASWKSRILLNKEILQSCREHGIKTNYFRIYKKYFSKIWEYIFP